VKKCQILHNSCYCSYTSFEYTLVWDSLFLDAITLMKKRRKFVWLPTKKLWFASVQC
jgi:hypothetical protein